MEDHVPVPSFVCTVFHVIYFVLIVIYITTPNL